MPDYFLTRFLFILTIVAAILSGCSAPKPTPSPDQMDKSPFTSIPCAAPCWYGLTVGESDENNVLATLSALTFINQNTIRSFRNSMPNLDLSTFAPGMKIVADCIYPTNHQCLSLAVVDNILTEIVIPLNYDIRVSDVIESLGAPDYLGYQNLGAERIICEVDLIWSSKQLVLASMFEGYKATEETCGSIRDTGKISSVLLISEVRYVSSAEIKRLLSPGTSEFFEYSGMITEK